MHIAVRVCFLVFFPSNDKHSQRSDELYSWVLQSDSTRTVIGLFWRDLIVKIHKEYLRNLAYSGHTVTDSTTQEVNYLRKWLYASLRSQRFCSKEKFLNGFPQTGRAKIDHIRILSIGLELACNGG